METRPGGPATVFIVDDTPSVCEALAHLFRSVGLAVETYSAPFDLIAREVPNGPGCIVSDVRMPQMGGIEMLSELRQLGWRLPAVFISGHATVKTAVRAMQAGAADFLEKPLDDEWLLARVWRAIAEDRGRVARKRDQRRLRSRYATLTARERDVLGLLLEGHANKEIASHLAISPKTVERHRAHVMAKTGAGSLAELVALAIRNDIGGKPVD